MLDREGQQLDNQCFVPLLGSGDFTDVFLGEHVYLNRQVVIKVLQAGLA